MREGFWLVVHAQNVVMADECEHASGHWVGVYDTERTSAGLQGALCFDENCDASGVDKDQAAAVESQVAVVPLDRVAY